MRQRALESTWAIHSPRPYRPALGIKKALEEISRYRGYYYDPIVADIFLPLSDIPTNPILQDGVFLCLFDNISNRFHIGSNRIS